MKRFKKVYTKVFQALEIVFYVVLVLFTIMASLSIAQDYFLKRELTVFGYKPIYIASGSMESNDHSKNIKESSVIIAKRVNEFKELKVGDVVTYELSESLMKGGQNITHRITALSKNNLTFKAKGDANDYEDYYENAEGYTGYMPSRKIKYKLALRLNWIAKLIALIRYKPLVLGMYAIGVSAGLAGLVLIHSLIFEKEYMFHFKKIKTKDLSV